MRQPNSMKPRWTAWLEVLNIPIACKVVRPFLSNRLSTSIDLPSNLKPSSAAWRTTATQGTAQGTPSPSHAHYRCIQAAKPSNTTSITACPHLLDGKDGIHTHEQHCGWLPAQPGHTDSPTASAAVSISATNTLQAVGAEA
jgi:hypothetical protein